MATNCSLFVVRRELNLANVNLSVDKGVKIFNIPYKLLMIKTNKKMKNLGFDPFNS